MGIIIFVTHYLQGISSVIKTLVDVVCPFKVEKGAKVAIHPTTFRYSN